MQEHFCYQNNPYQKVLMRTQMDLSEIFFNENRQYKSKKEIIKSQSYINEKPTEKLNDKTLIKAE
jgi:hypothetical protein